MNNYDGVRFEDVRRDLDEIFVDLAKEMSDAYYTYWKNGLSFPWLSWDNLTKAEFDTLHGTLHHLYQLALWNATAATNPPKRNQMAEQVVISRQWLAANPYAAPLRVEINTRFASAGKPVDTN